MRRFTTKYGDVILRSHDDYFGISEPGLATAKREGCPVLAMGEGVDIETLTVPEVEEMIRGVMIQIAHAATKGEL